MSVGLTLQDGITLSLQYSMLPDLMCSNPSNSRDYTQFAAVAAAPGAAAPPPNAHAPYAAYTTAAQASPYTQPAAASPYTQPAAAAATAVGATLPYAQHPALSVPHTQPAATATPYTQPRAAANAYLEQMQAQAPAPRQQQLGEATSFFDLCNRVFVSRRSKFVLRFWSNFNSEYFPLIFDCSLSRLPSSSLTAGGLLAMPEGYGPPVSPPPVRPAPQHQHQQHQHQRQHEQHQQQHQHQHQHQQQLQQQQQQQS